MLTSKKTIQYLIAFAATALVAACGGGGGGGGTIPPPPPPPTPTPTPLASPTPQLLGTLNTATGGTVAGGFTYSPAGNASIVFSCGCTGQAGTGTADGSGVFSLTTTSTATPAAPSPTYTIVPGRNYIVIAKSGAGAEAWTAQFAGNNTPRNIFINSGNTSDVYSAAVALYVFENSPSGTTAFDDWNFNTLVAWYNHLLSSPNTAETTLLNDIASQSATNKTLFPRKPGWNTSQSTNSIIATDLANVKTSGDAAIPTPCPGGITGCTNTPSP